MKTLPPFLVAVAISGTALAQIPQYPDFASVAGLELVDRAAQNGTFLRVHDEFAPTGGGNRGAAWFQTPVEVASGFDTTFTFSINQGGGPSTGGDGMAFVIQNELVANPSGGIGVTGIGRHASAMGYGLFVGSAPGESIDNSLVIEFDTFANGNQPAAAPILDPDGNHISIHTGGDTDNSQNESFSIGRAPSMSIGVDMSDGLIHTARIVYVPGSIDVYLDGALVLTTTYDFATGGTWLDSGMPVGGLDLMGGTSAWVGFVAASGGAVENHDVHSWTWGDGLGVNYCTSVANSTGQPARVFATGSVVIADADFTLGAEELPANQFGIFLTSRTQGFVPGVGGTSNGNLCLGGTIGRFTLPSQIVNSGSGGVFALAVPLGQMPQGAMFVPANAGETWFFQAWYRDGVGLGSNFTDGLEVAFQ